MFPRTMLNQASIDPALLGSFIELVADPTLGYSFFDDFVDGGVLGSITTSAEWNRYRVFGSTGATYAHETDEVGGVLTIGSDDDNEGANFSTVVGPIKIATANHKPFFFEARVKTSTIADTKHNVFVGLADPATAGSAIIPITADGVMANVSCIGFARLEADGDKWQTLHKQGATTVVKVSTTAVTPVDDAYNILGMVGDGRTVKFYADGVELASHVTSAVIGGATFPNDTVLAPWFAVLNATNTTPGTSSIDWWRMGQIR